MPTYEGLRLKILKYWRLELSNHRKKAQICGFYNYFKQLLGWDDL